MADTDPTQELALAKLKALVKVPGALRHIGAEHACGIPAGRHKPLTETEQSVCDAHEYDLKDPRHFVGHDVVRLEGPDERGYCTAYTKDGSWRMGLPTALFKRLTEATQSA